MNFQPKLMNFELTTKCPLLCPQCYCSLNTGKNMDLNVALFWIDQASENGISTINLSGGETLCYPNLTHVIRYASSKGIKTNIAISGYGLTEQLYIELIDAGVDGIFVSLNASTEQINCKSRNGYKYAIKALELLQEKNYNNTTINWVMQNSNSDDFPQLVEIAEKYTVARVVVMALKPNSKKELLQFPNSNQMNSVCQFIKNYTGSVQLCVESCFSQMLALINDSFLFGNKNNNEPIGCMAGRTNLSVNVDGELSPCRHLEIFEKRKTLAEYWTKSETLKKLREIEKHESRPCSSCRYDGYCRHCIAVNYAINNEIYIGYEDCPIYTKSGN